MLEGQAVKLTFFALQRGGGGGGGRGGGLRYSKFQVMEMIKGLFCVWKFQLQVG